MRGDKASTAELYEFSLMATQETAENQRMRKSRPVHEGARYELKNHHNQDFPRSAETRCPAPFKPEWQTVGRSTMSGRAAKKPVIAPETESHHSFRLLSAVSVELTHRPAGK